MLVGTSMRRAAHSAAFRCCTLLALRQASKGPEQQFQRAQAVKMCKTAAEFGVAHRQQIFTGTTREVVSRFGFTEKLKTHPCCCDDRCGNVESAGSDGRQRAYQRRCPSGGLLICRKNSARRRERRRTACRAVIDPQSIRRFRKRCTQVLRGLAGMSQTSAAKYGRGQAWRLPRGTTRQTGITSQG